MESFDEKAFKENWFTPKWNAKSRILQREIAKIVNQLGFEEYLSVDGNGVPDYVLAEVAVNAIISFQANYQVTRAVARDENGVCHGCQIRENQNKVREGLQCIKN